MLSSTAFSFITAHLVIVPPDDIPLENLRAVAVGKSGEPTDGFGIDKKMFKVEIWNQFKSPCKYVVVLAHWNIITFGPLAALAVVGFVRLMSLAVFLQCFRKFRVAERYQFAEAALLVPPAVIYGVFVDVLCSVFCLVISPFHSSRYSSQNG